MKILITGGAGFVGARLARTLLQRGTLDGRALQQIVLADQAQAPADLLVDARVQARVGPLLSHCEALQGEAFDGVFTWPRRCRVNARPISTSACAPTSTAPVLCSMRCGST